MSDANINDCASARGECQKCGGDAAHDERFCDTCEGDDEFVAESQLVDALIAVLECGTTLEDEDVPACTKARSLREAQYLTSDEGLVVTLANGQKFVLIVKEG